MLEKIVLSREDLMFDRLKLNFKNGYDEEDDEDCKDVPEEPDKPFFRKMTGSRVDLEAPLESVGLTLKREGDYYSADIHINSQGRRFRNLSKVFADCLKCTDYQFKPISPSGTGYIVLPSKKISCFAISFYSKQYHLVMGDEGSVSRKIEDIDMFKLEMGQFADITSKFIWACYSSVEKIPTKLPPILLVSC